MSLLNYPPPNQPKLFKRVSIINGIGNRRVHMQNNPQTVNRPLSLFYPGPRTTVQGKKATLNHEWKREGQPNLNIGSPVHIYTTKRASYYLRECISRG
jgi:hypothetical protein